MAMSKEEQREAARRIMEKLGPLDEREEKVYEQFQNDPIQYIPPDKETGKRVCGICLEEFEEERDKAGNLVKSSLEKFADHQQTHNPTTQQWTEAHRRIQSSKERSKLAEKQESGR